jgi:hypothetical protein
MKKLRENISRFLALMPTDIPPMIEEMRDLTLDFQAKLTILSAFLESSEYPCPICIYHGKRGADVGKVKLLWDVEYDDYYPISAVPHFESTCEDPSIVFGEIRVNSGFGYARLPYNHAEQMNLSLEDGGEGDSNANTILGAAQERRRIAEMLGIKIKRWGE